MSVNLLDLDFDEEQIGFQVTTKQHSFSKNLGKYLSLVALMLGLLVLALGMFGNPISGTWYGFVLSFGMMGMGGVSYFYFIFQNNFFGVRHDGVMFSKIMSRGWVGWVLGIFITGFYVLLYWWPNLLDGLVRMVNPLAYLITSSAADSWFLFGFLYTLGVLIFGFRMFMKYRYNPYQIIRTGSVMFFQFGFAFLIPQILKKFNEPEFYFTYFWPLKYDYLFPSTVSYLTGHPGTLGLFMVFWGIVTTFVVSPVLTFFFGKRWYCSWVCGCGGLAETLGDPFRQLSNKSLFSWKVERVFIYSVLVIITLTTGMLWVNSATDGQVFGTFSGLMARWYGFFIGGIFSGVIGLGFYPILGSRVWCRYGCPLAAILGFFQRFFSRFRITTNGEQCISCGNCSTYCEMGIDVRSYAQIGENIVRASCVGCGVCAAVCPRGVLKLENGITWKDRYPSSDRPLAAIREALGGVGVYGE